MNPDYVAPSLTENAFNCPHCGAFSHHEQFNVKKHSKDGGGVYKHNSLKITRCVNCKNHAYWVDGSLVHPKHSIAPLPAEDMPDEVKEVYSEARSIVNDSPRGAAALLRLAIQLLLEELGANGSGIYDMIGDLVANGEIDTEIQKAYDSIRVFGNESVHPGTINLNEDKDAALTLFYLLNEIVRSTISRKKRIEEMWDRVPETKKEGVEQRDSQ